MHYQMPANFLWGVATSAYQSEGGTTLDGRGPSIWDEFCKRPGMIKDASSGANTSRCYERWADDVRLLKELGVNAHRFSISWSRVLPTGRGQVNQKGLDYYSRLVDALLKNNIRPFIMLYHWDLPQALEDRGGWQVRETAEAFGEYAAVVVQRLGDRVKDWMTVEELATCLGNGYGAGGQLLAPGLRLTGQPLAQVYHHALVAHGLAVRAIRAGCPGARIGLDMDTVTPVPVIEDAAHIAACAAAYDRLNGFLTGPLFEGKYPAHLDALPAIQPGDMQLIAQPLDYLGLSIYSGIYFEPADDALGFRRVEFPEHYPMVRDLDWFRLVPPALYWSVRHAHTRYGFKSIYISENGYGTDCSRDADSLCNDLDRIFALRCYMRELHRAVTDGIPVHGYFNWSLLDDFEWGHGFTKSFGLYYNNPVTGERRPKRSYEWYKSVIRNNAVV